MLHEKDTGRWGDGLYNTVMCGFGLHAALILWSWSPFGILAFWGFTGSCAQDMRMEIKLVASKQVNVGKG